jgi:alpha-tubulin suppressor-like RCC1 family protein
VVGLVSLALVAGGTVAISVNSPATADPASFAQVSVGYSHACGVTTSGAAYCWGSDDMGELGNGAVAGDQESPYPVSTPAGVEWTSVTAGADHTCGLTTTGAAYCWGLGQFGPLGDGNYANHIASAPAPVMSPSGVTWASLTAADKYTCGLSTGGAAYCWGVDGEGQLGSATAFANTEAGTPALVDTPAGVSWSAVFPGLTNTCAITTTGAAYCWGTNTSGEIGNGTISSKQVEPALVGGPSGIHWTTVVPGNQFTCGVTYAGYP